VTIVSIDLVREYLEENFGELDDQPDELMSKAGSEISSAENTDVVVPAHIKAMSNEELAKAIEDLRR
jgi:NAD(P)H-hydrate repair Nnr-like enzyme with NAD(P)H-hydrate epimerase domain